MDQEQLRTIEGKCIQEQPPWCLAACPIHVDARALCGRVARENWDAAWKVLQKTMPLAGVLGRICDAPCQERCLRGAAGDPIQIGQLERAVLVHPAPRLRIPPLPAKNQRVAVVGSGLSGLTVAWDLVRKGYGVTIHEPGTRLGGCLLDQFPDRLDQDILEREIGILLGAKVGVRLEASVAGQADLEALLDEFDAVYLCLDAGQDIQWDLERESGAIRVDSELLTTSRDRVLAGGNVASPVFQAAQGRRAATTLDRLLQKVSLTANRQGEGPFETKLYTSLEGVEPLDAVEPADPGAGFTSEEAAREAGRCLQCECMECVKACAYLQHYKGYPKTYARQIYNNEAIVQGHKLANKLINSCMLCGQCTVICPHDFSMAELCLETRNTMVKRGSMPPSAFDFALEDLRFNLSPDFSLFRHAPGTTASEYLFFPGCQLCASRPEHVEAVYAWMRDNVSRQTALALACCGAPALWAGEQSMFEEILEGLANRWRELGEPTLVAACATCHDVLKTHAPHITTISLWELMSGKFSELKDSRKSAPPLAIHDPCGAREYPGLLQGARNLLQEIGQPVHELALGREFTSCCGYGGLLYSSNPGLARQVAEARTKESGLDYLAYCAMCRDNLAATGKRVWHILDLLFQESGSDDPAALPAPGFSHRQETKARLKRRLLESLWKEDGPPMKEYQHLVLALNPDVEALLERRRILLDDVRQVVFQAEQSGMRFTNPDSGRFLAYYKPVRVTYWVEYAPEGDSFRVFNAYSHRMTIPGPKAGQGGA